MRISSFLLSFSRLNTRFTTACSNDIQHNTTMRPPGSRRWMVSPSAVSSCSSSLPVARRRAIATLRIVSCPWRYPPGQGSPYRPDKISHRLERPRSHDGCGDPPRHPFVRVPVNQVGQVLLGQPVRQVRCRELLAGILAHIEKRPDIVQSEARAPVKLIAADSAVNQGCPEGPPNLIKDGPDIFHVRAAQYHPAPHTFQLPAGLLYGRWITVCTDEDRTLIEPVTNHSPVTGPADRQVAVNSRLAWPQYLNHGLCERRHMVFTRRPRHHSPARRRAVPAQPRAVLESRTCGSELPECVPASGRAYDPRR